MSKYTALVASLCMTMMASTGYTSTMKPPADNAFPFNVLIDNGDVVKDTSQAPYSSLVKVNFNGYLCTGTLINYNEVLTAGHCAEDKNSKKIDPAAYTITSSDGKTSWHAKRVETSYIQNPESDFAVLTIDNTDKNVPTVALASEKVTQQFLLTDYPPLLAVGYGIDLARPDKNYNADLQQGVITPTSQFNAEKTVSNGVAWFLSKGLVLPLKYDPKGVFATCSKQPTDHGDSGGPVFYKNPADNEIYLVGTTSRGLTVKNPGERGEFLSYDHCIDHSNVDQEGQKLSVFTDLTYNSLNYQKLKNIETQMNKD